ncbi:N-acetylglucosamine-6-phosphate deacetylase [Flavilitoribacter nigricans]|uniref:N-acetylglucosamine-6-phosphate deacetylase n=1 Tax=Flavilitoribacter nigricans (strain ATCC 23147 / DSM 23189 / NBRC 102662 / NCIMB 1420 / SS-2) TaxID=1122177 RepID=A0A2D0NI47_FLAN2|nr:N-acetylglucosamine-6-phosphate deacetylase [Flavilitoribacter nigricans]PHN07839.1 N-acetylglucosamine-6-phosphate deacetylase [Flavilitoribacter nigricans DSM 23189 = NBRC 102662]
MKSRIFQIIVLLMAFHNTINGQSNETSVTGLLYLDGSPVQITMKQGVITGMQPLDEDAAKPELYIAPGLIDIQINGYMGIDFTGEDLDLDGMRAATKRLWEEGVTTYLPTVITADHERLAKNFAVLGKAMQDPEIGPSIPGLHLEGPYISPIAGFRGAHLEKYVRIPDSREFKTYQQAAKGGIKLVTLAPEAEGAMPFIRQLVDEDIIVSLGHHNGSAAEIKQAVYNGASLSTHLGNGCANEINRHYNPLWPQLAEDGLSISIIVDGYHLTREEVRSFYKAKGPEKTILVSDALDLAGLEPGEYIRGERTVVLTPNVIKFPAENVLAGAASPIRLCVGNMMNYTQCSLAEAIRMASTNPAELMQLEDRGILKPGKRADLVLFTLENGEMNVQQTIVGGKVVYER